MGPKTDAAIGNHVDEILTQHHADEWITVEVKWDAVEKFKAITRGKPTAETPFRRIVQQVPPCISATTLQTLRDRRPWMGFSH